MEDFRIQFLIPVFDDVSLLYKTIESIIGQEYDLKKIYVTIAYTEKTADHKEIVKLKSLLPHIGFYCDGESLDRRQMLSKMQRVLRWCEPGGDCYTSVLYPGDYIAPGFVKKCMEVFEKESMISCRFSTGVAPFIAATGIPKRFGISFSKMVNISVYEVKTITFSFEAIISSSAPVFSSAPRPNTKRVGE